MNERSRLFAVGSDRPRLAPKRVAPLSPVEFVSMFGARDIDEMKQLPRELFRFVIIAGVGRRTREPDQKIWMRGAQVARLFKAGQALRRAGADSSEVQPQSLVGLPLADRVAQDCCRRIPIVLAQERGGSARYRRIMRI